MNCRHARSAILHRIDGSLKLEVGFALDQHLDTCESCQLQWERSQELEEALVQMQEPALASLDVEAAVTRIRQNAQAQPSVNHWRRNRERVACAIAAGTLFSLATFWIKAPLQLDQEEVVLEHSPATEQLQVDDPAQPEQIEPAELEVASVRPEDSLDDKLLKRARQEVRTALLLEVSALQERTVDLAAFASRFDESANGLRRLGWPVLRLVEHALADEDVQVASAAARYLGLRGDRSSLRHMEDALERVELAEQITLALGDAGKGGLAGLAVALARPEQRSLASELIVRMRSEQASHVLASAFATERAASSGTESGSDLLASLVAMGDVSLPALMDLGQREVISVPDLCELLMELPGAGSMLANALNADQPSGRKSRERVQIRLRCAAIVVPDMAAQWMLAHVHERSWREFVLEQLPTLKSTALIDAIVQLDGDSRLSTQELDRLVRDSLRSNPRSFTQAIAYRVQGSSPEWQRSLAERLVAADTVAALAPALGLIHSFQLKDNLRSDLITLVGEYGSVDNLLQVQTVFENCTEDNRSLAAACLVTIERLGGPSAVSEALQGADSRSLSNLLHLLRRRQAWKRTAPSIYKLSRELRPFLRARDLNTKQTSS
ncbi:MAG: hypothetical protein ACI9F9_000646 [Candidatus Paceibacteria bacterium]|jgi:hypothetical protein